MAEYNWNSSNPYSLVEDGRSINETNSWTTFINSTYSNTSEELRCPFPEGWDWISAYQPIFMWVLFVLGFIENIIVLTVFLLHKNRCTVAEIYLGNMAAADLLLICGLPFWAINVSNNFHWPFGSFLCIAINTIILVNLNSSVYFLMMVSIDRYLALVKTMSFGRMRRAGYAKLICMVIWIFAVLVSLPKSSFRVLTPIEQLNVTACILQPPSDDWFIATNIMINTIGFLLPVVVISFCTFKIIEVLSNNTMQQFKEVKTEKKATMLVLAVLLVFIICWLPYHIVTFVDTLVLFKVVKGCGISDFLQIGSQISSYCGYSNSCINPLLYVMVGNHFRKKTKEVYKQFKTRGQKKNSIYQIDYSGDTVRTSISMGPQKIRI
ncbi:B2 bradykinin receptor [Bombina bombina]|uniref:B2 bradykinin receptor n=1 Tax=Bombina bombina TaxID=8345 RepID=UPI00235B2227|nr:B2 bradykinin receptor [Bombina bombina]